MKCHSHNTKDEIDFFINRLKDSGCRITKQRKTMADSIIKFGLPFSAEDLHGKVKKQGIDLVTVYRSLSAFTELNILTTVDFQEGALRYEYLHSKEQGHHHHIICTQCKKIQSLHVCTVSGQEKELEKMGYSNVSHKLEFFGLCKKCSA